MYRIVMLKFFLVIISLSTTTTWGFSIFVPMMMPSSHVRLTETVGCMSTFSHPFPSSPNRYTVDTTRLYMSDMERVRTTKKKVQTITKDDTETKAEEQKKKEEMWRVVLHNDEVHTFNYVVRSLCKVIGTLDRKAAFEICVQTHGIGKATITKSWKKQAEQYCLGLQRQGLTVSIAPDEDFDGGHSGGGL